MTRFFLDLNIYTTYRTWFIQTFLEERTVSIFSHPEDGGSKSLRNTETNKTHREV